MNPSSGARRVVGFDENRLPQTLARLTEDEGGAAAVVEFTREGRRELSFADLREQAGRLGAGLRDRDEPGKDAGPVVLFAPASAQAVMAVVGILRAGRVVVPIDTQMEDEDLKSVLENSGGRLVVTTQELAGRLRALDGVRDLDCFALDEGGEARPLKDLLTREPDDSPEPNADDVAVIFYTSGTTGRPKGVPLTHRNIRFQLETVARSGLIRKDDRVLLPLPLHHVYPFVVGMLAPLAFGLPVILPEELTGPALARAMREGKATVSMGVPRLYQAFYGAIRERVGKIPGGNLLLSLGLPLARTGWRAGLPVGRWIFRPVRRQAAPCLRLLASGGSPLSPALARDLEAIGWPVAIGYGLTETSPLLTLKKPGEGSSASVGRAVDGVELRTDPAALKRKEEEMEEALSGASSGRGQAWGELLARGPNVFSGYHGLKDENHEVFAPGNWFRTGDIARIDEKGFVYLRGRISTRIALQGGENVDPAELEERYGEVAGIAEIGILEDDGRLAALVVPDDGFVRDRGPRNAADAIRESLNERGKNLPSYQRIARVEFSSHPLQRTRIGKLRRHALQEAYKAATGAGEGGRAGDEAAPVALEDLSSEDRALLGDHRARALWDLLCSRYRDRPVAPEAHLEIDLGIDSMEWVQLSLLIEETTGAKVDDSLIGRVNRVRDLLAAVAEAPGEAEGGSRRPLEDPEAVIDPGERHWAEPRNTVRLVVATFLYSLVRIYMRAALRVEARGLENLPDTAFILAPNHASYLDAPAVGVALGYRRARRFFWAGATAIMFRNCVVREISRLAQIVPIDPRRGPLSSLAFVALVLERKRPLAWFPEGQVSQDGSLQEFQPGIGLLLQHRDNPVVPVYIEGTHAALPRGRVWPRCGRIRVWFGKPRSAEDLLRGAGDTRDPATIAAALREAVAELRDQAAGRRPR